MWNLKKADLQKQRTDWWLLEMGRVVEEKGKRERKKEKKERKRKGERERKKEREKEREEVGRNERDREATPPPL